jgi:hypothetical protein
MDRASAPGSGRSSSDKPEPAATPASKPEPSAPGRPGAGAAAGGAAAAAPAASSPGAGSPAASPTAVGAKPDTASTGAGGAGARPTASRSGAGAKPAASQPGAGAKPAASPSGAGVKPAAAKAGTRSAPSQPGAGAKVTSAAAGSKPAAPARPGAGAKSAASRAGAKPPAAVASSGKPATFAPSGKPATAAPAGKPAAPAPPARPAAAAAPSSAPPAPRPALDARSFVVVGEGLAAGIDHFSLSGETQEGSFGALLARSLGTGFNQPVLQGPGTGNVPGLQALPIRVPVPPQTTVRADYPPRPSLGNLSVPGFTLSDARRRRPLPPLVHQHDSTQTLANLILGYPALLTSGAAELPTQLELAERARPGLAVVALGYTEAVSAAVAGDTVYLPHPAAFAADLAAVAAALARHAGTVVVATVPDPIDTAYVSTPERAATLSHTDPAFLAGLYQLRRGDLLTVPGLVEVGWQFTAHDIGKPLPPGSVLAADVAAAIGARVSEINREIARLDGAHGGRVVVYDLYGLFRRLRASGIDLGGHRLSADYLGGFYLLNGFYPGATGHALIAAELVELLRQRRGARLAPVDVDRIAADDPLLQVTFPGGPPATEDYRRPLSFADFPPPPPPSQPPQPAPLQFPVGIGLPTPVPLAQPLQLPPGLVQELPLVRGESYFGDALRAMNCPSDPPGPGGLPPLGLCGNLLFGGLCLTNSHLSGPLRIKFSPPVGSVSHFEVSLPQGLMGEDGTLEAPLFFRLPSKLNLVRDFPGLVSAGDLDLATGMVSNLQFYFSFFNTAIAALASVNPHFPFVPIQFPGLYGGAAARFDQRSDGLLDLTFYGSTFFPLGIHLGPDVLRFPLPWSNVHAQCIGFPAPTTSIHPHIRLTSRAAPAAERQPDAMPPRLPQNTIVELATRGHNSPFGDAFSLDIPELGGDAVGRSHLIGRVQVQLGPHFGGDAVSVAVSSMPPGGYLSLQPPNPYAANGVSMGLLGHDEILHFPKQAYGLNDVFFADDPYDVPVGAASLASGRFLGDLLYRGFIGQDVIFALAQLEPRTPKSSFGFRGPASLERGPDGGLVFRFTGDVLIPYPQGFKFPQPNLKDTFVVIGPSHLDPYLWLQAIEAGRAAGFYKQGEDRRVIASTGQVFSYRYLIPADPRRDEASFEYVNHTQGGTFRLLGLAWVSFFNSPTAEAGEGEYDTVTFTAYGTWSLDPQPAPHVATVQFSTAPEAPYVSIQIDGGQTSNVNTKPANIEDARP